jgi:hypothetical protein
VCQGQCYARSRDRADQLLKDGWKIQVVANSPDTAALRLGRPAAAGRGQPFKFQARQRAASNGQCIIRVSLAAADKFFMPPDYSLSLGLAG